MGGGVDTKARQTASCDGLCTHDVLDKSFIDAYQRVHLSFRSREGELGKPRSEWHGDSNTTLTKSSQGRKYK